MQVESDVVIVGGGISGLTAAYQLHKKDPSLRIHVLEAKDRVGGRTLTVPLKTKTGTDKWDLGGQWVGRCQPHIMAMLEELGLETHCQYVDGLKFMQLGDNKVRSFSSDIPSLSIFALLDLNRILNKIESMREMVDPDDPFKCPHAVEWDSMTVETFLKNNLWTQGARDAVDACNRCMLGVESSQISVLYYLMYASAAGNFDNLIKATEYKGQEYRIKGGAQQVCELLAKSVGSKSVLLNHPVVKIEQNVSHAMVHLQNGDVFKCNKVIIATPPYLTNKIQFDPVLPTDKREIMKRMTISSIMKIIITFKEAFWRTAGQSGEIVTNGGPSPSEGCEKGPLCIVYDATTAFDSPALVAFIGGKAAVQWGNRSAEERKSAVLQSLSQFFGQEIWSHLDYKEQNWGVEPYTEGGPVCCVAPGAMEYFASGLRHPFYKLHFAGTESATVWCGFMNGAVQSGIRAAHEVLYHLRPQSVSPLELADTAYRQTAKLMPKKKGGKMKKAAVVTISLSVILLTMALLKKRIL